ncbi:amidohydrolase family protein [Flexithrix dorotheae]|uniref:amidohydrolase family protein n=1 Tax=Flexithrix dorotheae TaxID=70993 RepID=UPI0003A348E3|nr:amidohydrolase family protein [Flexithrix dorotheae]
MKHLAIFLFLPIFFYCSQPKTAEKVNEAGKIDQDLAFIDVSVIAMEAEIVLEHQDVLITDGRISKIAAHQSFSIEENVTRIDGKGKFLTPGLAELHAHIPVANENDELVKETLFLYLSNGITTIRGMLGDPYHLKLRKEVENGDVLGPRIYTSGPSLNGNTVQTVEEAVKKVTDQKNAGYDFLKLHPGLKRNVFDAIVETANKVGIKFAGHVSIDVGIQHALESGYWSIDHLDGYVEGLVPQSVNVNPNDNGFFGFNFTTIADQTKIDDLAQKTKAAGVWVVPTESLLERFTSAIPPGTLAQQGEMKYMNPGTIRDWVSRKEQFLMAKNYNQEMSVEFLKIRKQLIKSLHDHSAGLLLGSDAPQIFNVPGFSIQHEMGYMVEAGLSPFETLKMGTTNPAEFFEATHQFGKIKEGLAADLILLSENPLDDIGNMREIEGVMVRGKWLTKAFIKEQLDAIANKYSQ